MRRGSCAATPARSGKGRQANIFCEVFNLTVSDTHTFFVSGGDTDIYWVHNK